MWRSPSVIRDFRQADVSATYVDLVSVFWRPQGCCLVHPHPHPNLALPLPPSLMLLWRWRHQVPPSYWQPPTRPYSSLSGTPYSKNKGLNCWRQKSKQEVSAWKGLHSHTTNRDGKVMICASTAAILAGTHTVQFHVFAQKHLGNYHNLLILTVLSWILSFLYPIKSLPKWPQYCYFFYLAIVCRQKL